MFFSYKMQDISKKKEEWRDCLRAWTLADSSSERALLNVEEEMVALLALRRGLTDSKSCVVVLPTLAKAEAAASWLESWSEAVGKPLTATLLPETGDAGVSIPENEARRGKALRAAAASNSASWFVASVMSLLAPAPPPDRFAKGSFTLKPGLTLSPSELAERLVRLDYDDEFQVSAPGEFARRGGLFDIFSPAFDCPVRIEFFGDEIESLRLFSAETQRATGFTDSYEIIPRSVIEAEDSRWNFLDYFKERPLVIAAFPTQTDKHVELFGKARHG